MAAQVRGTAELLCPVRCPSFEIKKLKKALNNSGFLPELELSMQFDVVITNTGKTNLLLYQKAYLGSGK